MGGFEGVNIIIGDLGGCGASDATWCDLTILDMMISPARIRLSYLATYPLPGLAQFLAPCLILLCHFGRDEGKRDPERDGPRDADQGGHDRSGERGGDEEGCKHTHGEKEVGEDPGPAESEVGNSKFHELAGEKGSRFGQGGVVFRGGWRIGTNIGGGR